MPLQFKINILDALKEKGYNTNRLRKEKLLSEGAIQALRENEDVKNKHKLSWDSISKICGLLDCQPGDILIYKKD